MIQIYLDTAQWGRFEITERVAQWSFDTRDGVGWATARLQLDGPMIELWVLTEHVATDVVEFYAGADLLWRGYLAGPEISNDGLELQAEGPGLRLRDVGVWRSFSDARTRWWTVSDDLPDGLRADNNNRVAVLAKGTGFEAGAEAGVIYPETGAELGAGIVRLACDVELTITTGAWIAEIRDDASNVLWTSAVAVDTSVDLVVADAGGLVVALRKDGAGDGEASLILTQVVVQTLPAATNSTVASEIFAAASLVDTAIEESGMAVDDAVWQEESQLQALQALALLGDGEVAWRLLIYEQARFEAWPTEVDWELRREDLGQWRISWRRDAVYNAVRARLSDGWLSDWQTDDDSIARWGRREMVLNLPYTTRAEAERLVAITLDDKADALAGLQLTGDAYCRTPDGARRAIWLIRAGDLVRLRDLLPDQDIVIRVAETRATADGLDITPAGQDDRLETLLAAMEQR